MKTDLRQESGTDLVKGCHPNIVGFREFFLKLLFIVESIQFFRDLFRSDVLQRLLEDPENRILIATTYESVAIDAEFSHPRLRVYPLKLVPPSFINRLTAPLLKDLYALEHPSDTFAQHRQTTAQRLNKKQGLRLVLAGFLHECGLRSSWLISMGEEFGSDPLFSSLLVKEKPDAVLFSTMIPYNLECLRETKRHGIPLILAVTSWDHPTSKGPLTATPDGALVWSEEMRRELAVSHDLGPDTIIPVGVLYFETYFRRENLLSKAEFSSELGIDPGVKIIHYATGDSSLIRCNQEFIRILQRIVVSGQLGQPCHLLVRVSPKDLFHLYEEFENSPETTVQYPKGKGSLYGSNQWLPSSDEDCHRASTILHSDVILSVSSSMVLDAVCFDKPIVNLAYDAGLQLEFWDSVDRFYRYSHARPVLESDSTWVVKNEAELVKALGEALLFPEGKKEERRVLLERIIQFNDGKTSQRWVEAIRQLLQPAL